jgi:predicted TPR repeat methyltransferase
MSLEFSDLESFRALEASLRHLLKDRPQNGRAMSKLACLLADNAKRFPDSSSQKQLIAEGFDWADRSIRVAPDKPFGYMALSILETDHFRREQALRKALAYHKDKDSSFVKLGLLIRLLVEPKEHESQLVQGKIGRASPRHPCRLPLHATEELIYRRITEGLAVFWTTSMSTTNRQEMAKREYHLGLFFRKRLPSETSRRRARRHLEQAVRSFPEDDQNQRAVVGFWLGTLTSAGASCRVDRCPASYVVGLYSTFAERFDDLLVDKLGYKTPQLLRQLVDRSLAANRFQRGLDLGCGTGLSGMAFRDIVVGELTGVDLSPEMIAKAEKRQCYEALEVDDVTTFLSSKDASSLDLIFACDVFVYLGDLEDVFAQVHKVLRTGGVFCFSSELLDPELTEDDYLLHECARFAHSRPYIERLAKSFLVLDMKVRALRKNQGEDVMGLLTVLRKED